MNSTPETLYHCKLCNRSNFVKKAAHKVPPGGSEAASCPGDFVALFATNCFTCNFKAQRACPDASVITREPWKGCNAWYAKPATSSTPSVPSVPSAVTPPPNYQLTTGTWDGARHWLNAGQRAEQIKLFCQVMLGFELQRLSAEHGVVNGNNQHEGRVSHDGKPTTEDWETILHKETGLSKSTAYRFMDMARAAAPRLKRIPALKNFDPAAQSIAALPETTGTALEKAVKKLTDGHTQKEFGEMLGLWKKPSGNPNAKGSGQPAKKLTTEEEARLLREMALTDSGALGNALKASNKNFFLLTEVNDLEVNSQIAVLEHALKLRRAWLALPKAKRDPAAIESLLKDDPYKF